MWSLSATNLPHSTGCCPVLNKSILLSSNAKQPLILPPTTLISNEQICPCFLSTRNCHGCRLKVKPHLLINCMDVSDSVARAEILLSVSLIFIDLFICYCIVFSSTCYCHHIQMKPKLKLLCSVVVTYFIAAVWVSPLKSPGAFWGTTWEAAFT